MQCPFLTDAELMTKRLSSTINIRTYPIHPIHWYLVFRFTIKKKLFAHCRNYKKQNKTSRVNNRFTTTIGVINKPNYSSPSSHMFVKSLFKSGSLKADSRTVRYVNKQKVNTSLQLVNLQTKLKQATT